MIFENNKENNEESLIIKTVQCSYSREKMLTLNDSPICMLRPQSFHSVVQYHPELVRLAPSPDACTANLHN